MFYWNIIMIMIMTLYLQGKISKLIHVPVPDRYRSTDIISLDLYLIGTY